MDEHDFPQQVSTAVLRLTHLKGRQLAGRYGFVRQDAEDIQQDLLLDYLQRSRSFDSQRCSRRTFAQLVVNNCVANIIEAREASCRGYRVRRLSLSERLDRKDDPNASELADILIDPSSRILEAKLNLRLDVDRLLTRLPSGLVSLCRSIMTCDTTSEAAAKAGISRATLYRQIQSVRTAFAQAGMDN